MLTSVSRPIRTLLFGAIIVLVVGLLGPGGAAVAAPNPVTLTASITGTPTVGQTVTAVADSLDPNNADLTYRWQTTDPATDILGATSSTLLLTSDLVGKQVQVTISATANNRDPGTATSTATATVQGLFTVTPVVELDDTTPVVDAPITASITTPSTPAPDSYAYEWYADGDLIVGATNAVYTPTASDVTKQLVAKATAVKANYFSVTGSSSATDAVVKADFTASPSVTITGTLAVGATLTANASGEAPTGDAYTYQWKADNADIVGATGVTFTPGAEQHGKALTVTVTATKAGYNDGAAVTSAPTGLLGMGVFTTPATVALSTTFPKVGTVLKATPSGADPAADSYTYQWYRVDNAGTATAITGANAATYTVVDADLTRRLRVKVFAVKAGYASKSTLSIMTSRVNKITVSKTPIPHGHTLTVTAEKLRAGQSYRIYIGATRVYTGTVGSTGKVTRIVRVPSATGAQRVRVSGYNKAGTRDFTVFTTITVT